MVEEVAGALVVAAEFGEGVVDDDEGAGVKDGFEGEEVLDGAVDGVIAVDVGEVDAAGGFELGLGVSEVVPGDAFVEGDELAEPGEAQAVPHPFFSIFGHAHGSPGAGLDGAEVIEAVHGGVLVVFEECGGDPVGADGEECSGFDDDAWACVADEAVEHEAGLGGERGGEDDGHFVHFGEAREPGAIGVFEVVREGPAGGVARVVEESWEVLEACAWEGVSVSCVVVGGWLWGGAIDQVGDADGEADEC